MIRPGPATALGVHVPRCVELSREILGDLSPNPPYGVAWWAPHPGTSRRILISDHLFACAQSVGDNLIERRSPSLRALRQVVSVVVSRTALCQWQSLGGPGQLITSASRHPHHAGPVGYGADGR